MRRALVLALALLVGTALADEKPRKPKCDFQPSPHFTEATRGKKGTINYIVIHTVEGTYKGCISWFKNPKAKVSAHYVVSFQGEITQMVKDADQAWHAGVKLYNEEGIGIEHEGHAARNGWTEAQLKASADLVRWLCKTYEIPIDRKHILAHSEVAPGRKSDPGPFFPWDAFLAHVKDPKAKLEPVKEGAKKDE